MSHTEELEQPTNTAADELYHGKEVVDMEEDVPSATPPRPLPAELIRLIEKLDDARTLNYLADWIQQHVDVNAHREEAARTAERLERMKAAWNAPRCGHVKADGTPCGSPAVREQKLCYFHGRAAAAVADTAELPTVEDHNSLQLAIQHVCQRVATGRMEDKTARLLLDALAMAGENLQRLNLE
jgi:hypothetical protein